MRIGNAARNWRKLEPSEEQYATFRAVLDREAEHGAPGLELAYLPFRMEDGLRQAAAEPPATLLILPDGRVQGVGGAALRRRRCAPGRAGASLAILLPGLACPEVRAAVEAAAVDGARHAQANAWQELAESTA
ncbi:MAG: hypothetical protein U5L06_05300 [Rhodovibrio sp.]|nr:hypothetical protein [Rhodovibrio sp.]